MTDRVSKIRREIQRAGHHGLRAAAEELVAAWEAHEENLDPAIPPELQIRLLRAVAGTHLGGYWTGVNGCSPGITPDSENWFPGHDDPEECPRGHSLEDGASWRIQWILLEDGEVLDLVGVPEAGSQAIMAYDVGPTTLRSDALGVVLACLEANCGAVWPSPEGVWPS